MKIVKLGDVLEKTSTIKWKEQPGSRIYSYIDLTSVSRISHEITQTSEVNAKNAPSRAQKIVESGDVLFGTTRPTLNRLCIVSEEYDGQICSTGFCILRANGELVTSSFIYYLLTTKRFMEYVEATQRGTSYPAVTDKDVKQFEFVLPPLGEQRSIVARLDAAFEKISAAEVLMRQNLDNVAMLQKSILHKYLSASDSTHTHRLVDLLKIRHGRDWKGLASGKVPVYGSGGFMGKFVDTFSYDKPTVLLPRKGTITNIFYLDEPFWNVDTVFYTDIDDDRLLPRYFYHFMQTVDLKSLDSGSGRPSLTQTALYSIEMPLPSVAEQTDAVEKMDSALKSVEQLSKKYNEKLTKLIALRQSLLAQAFSTTNTV